MPRPRRLARLLLVCLLFAAQAALFAHSVAHDSGLAEGGEETLCHLCVAGHSMGAALAGQVPVFTPEIFPTVLPEGIYAAAPDTFPIRPHQRGPPRFS